MSAFPLSPIPAQWAARGACPVCGAAPLALEPPDQLACPRCGTAFQVEAGGPRLRLVRLPAAISCSGPDAEWRTAAEARAWVRELAAPPPAAPAPSVEPPLPAEPSAAPGAGAESAAREAVPAEALAHAQGLFALRHTVPQIERILLSAHTWTPAEVAAVLEAMRPAVAAAQARQRRLGWRLAGAGMAVVTLGLALTAWAMLAGNTAPPAAAGLPPAASAAPTSAASGLPAGLQTLIPPGARLVNATPVIRRGTLSGAPGASACPRTAEAAADLFGGAAGDWRYDQASRGWMLFSQTSLITVRVPAKMVAGYLEFGQSLNVSQVDGPATLDGVNMVVISCE
ncbi:MAG: hypothetical protein JNK29_16005 [Anaerolineales bacterium]|nr:hypothetical protein [Anaerolineales bacterium]